MVGPGHLVATVESGAAHIFDISVCREDEQNESLQGSDRALQGSDQRSVHDAMRHYDATREQCSLTSMHAVASAPHSVRHPIRSRRFTPYVLYGKKPY